MEEQKWSQKALDCFWGAVTLLLGDNIASTHYVLPFQSPFSHSLAGRILAITVYQFFLRPRYRATGSGKVSSVPRPMTRIRTRTRTPRGAD